MSAIFFLQCLEPCKESWDLKENQCQDLCEVCAFLRSEFKVTFSTLHGELKQSNVPAAAVSHGWSVNRTVNSKRGLFVARKMHFKRWHLFSLCLLPFLLHSPFFPRSTTSVWRAASFWSLWRVWSKATVQPQRRPVGLLPPVWRAARRTESALPSRSAAPMAVATPVSSPRTSTKVTERQINLKHIGVQLPLCGRARIWFCWLKKKTETKKKFQRFKLKPDV